MACLAPHNIPTGFPNFEDSDGNIVPGDWQKNVQSGNSALEEIGSLLGSHAKKSALDTRDNINYNHCFFLNSVVFLTPTTKNFDFEAWVCMVVKQKNSLMMIALD